MSDKEKKKGNWRLLLVGVILGSVITVGAFGIYHSVLNKGKTLKWADWTGFGEDTTIEETRQKQDNQGSFTEGLPKNKLSKKDLTFRTLQMKHDRLS